MHPFHDPFALAVERDVMRRPAFGEHSLIGLEKGLVAGNATHKVGVEELLPVLLVNRGRRDRQVAKAAAEWAVEVAEYGYWADPSIVRQLVLTPVAVQLLIYPPLQ